MYVIGGISTFGPGTFRIGLSDHKLLSLFWLNMFFKLKKKTKSKLNEKCAER